METSVPAVDLVDQRVRKYVRAVPHCLGGVGSGNLCVVDDAGVGRPYSLDAGGVRLDLVQPLPADQLEALGAIGSPSSEELGYCRRLGVVGCDYDLAAHLVIDAALVAESAEHPGPRRAEVGLPRPRRVVDAGMYDAAVVARLVLGQLGLLLQYRHLQAGETPGEAHGDGEADYAPSHDDEVSLLSIDRHFPRPHSTDRAGGNSITSRPRAVLLGRGLGFWPGRYEKALPRSGVR